MHLQNNDSNFISNSHCHLNEYNGVKWHTEINKKKYVNLYKVSSRLLSNVLIVMPCSSSVIDESGNIFRIEVILKKWKKIQETGIQF
jgi:hypothetical protein